MPDRVCIEAVKKVYAISDALYDFTDVDLVGQERATILNLLTDARNLALECGCDGLFEAADELRIAVAKNEKTLDDLHNAVAELKKTAKACLKTPP